MREARLTGSTPIVTPEEAEAARQQADAAPAAPAAPEPVIETTAAPVAEPVTESAAAPSSVESQDSVAGEEPLTRRQVREQERIRTGSVPVSDPSSQSASSAAESAPSASQTSAGPAVPSFSVPPAPAPVTPTPTPAAPAAPEQAGMITDVPRPSYPSRRRSYGSAATAAPTRVADEQDGVDDAEQDVAPVSVSSVMRAEEETGRTWHADPVSAAPRGAESERPVVPARPADPAPSPLLPAVPAAMPAAEPDSTPVDLPFSSEQSALWSAAENPAPAAPATPMSAEETPRPLPKSAPADSGSTLNPGFGERVLAQQPRTPQADSFDALIGDSTGSHHAAPNALIFQQAPGGLSLSGPVASTGEILVTGSYELPSGLGSRGHADGVADGKEVDAVLVDGELAPASSPTPIAASAAIGTIKPAGEVIRPPEPEKGNKLMLALTITAGALAVALVGALIVAITTGAFS
ncbi:hypothetical protein ACTJI8_00910 [Microbacterium sp. 22303]|uniref:hypothetical protein n=1 Tax=Microbacterium sp. 22303 TaxID=3453905 RepID=UPI003F84359E